MNILILFIFLFWATTLLKNILFWAYLWQVKEYRQDRMKVHFELSSAKSLLFNKRAIWLFLFFATSVVPFFVSAVPFQILVLAFYFFFAFRAGQQLQKRLLKFQK